MASRKGMLAFSLRKDAVLLNMGSDRIPVASIAHLIALKTGTGRSKDALDIEELRKLQQDGQT